MQWKFERKEQEQLEVDLENLVHETRAELAEVYNPEEKRPRAKMIEVVTEGSEVGL